MADNLQKLLVELGYGTTGLDQDSKKVLDKVNSLSQDMSKGITNPLDNASKTAGTHGKKAGENFVKAYSKEMDIVKDVLRKTFGATGAIIADSIEIFKKMGESRFGKVLINPGVISTSHNVESAAAAAIGTAGGVRVASRMFLPVDLASKSGNIVPTDLGKTIFANQPNIGLFEKSISFVGNSLRNVLTSLVGFPLTIASSVAAVVAAFGTIASIRNKAREKEIKLFQTSELVKEIENIKDPIEQTKKIIEELGNDGQAKFRELQKAVKDFNEELKNPSGWRAIGENASIVWKEIKNGLGSIWSSTKNVAGSVGSGLISVANWIMKKTGLSNYQYADNQDAIDISQGDAKSRTLQAELDKKKADKIKEKELQKQLDDSKLETKRSGMTSEQLRWSLEAEIKTLSILKEQAKSKIDALKIEIELNKVIDRKNELVKTIAEKTKSDLKEQAKLQDDINNLVDKKIKNESLLQERTSIGLSELSKTKLGVNDNYNSPIGNFVYTRAGMQNVIAARQIENLESWSKNNRLNGFNNLASQQSSMALSMREKLGILPSNERNILQDNLKENIEIKKGIFEIVTLAKEKGLKVKIPNA